MNQWVRFTVEPNMFYRIMSSPLKLSFKSVEAAGVDNLAYRNCLLPWSLVFCTLN